MSRIYAKAQREKLNQDLDELLVMIDDMKDGNFQISRQKILARLDEWITGGKEKETEPTETGWDFSKEEAGCLFAEDDIIQLRPFSSGDEKFYFMIREQYKIFQKNSPEEQLIAIYWEGTQKSTTFYCVIERVTDHEKLGYIALKTQPRSCGKLQSSWIRHTVAKDMRQGLSCCFYKKLRKSQAEVSFSFWWRLIIFQVKIV